jgi:predicted permease
MLAKLLVTPLLMVGIAKIMDLDGRSGRAAVLIATLPISLASFTLGKQYGVGEAALAANVAVGTLLMLPTVIAWSAAMDHAGLYVV